MGKRFQKFLHTLKPKPDAPAVHRPLDAGCGSHTGDHWCGGFPGHEGLHVCGFCVISWPPA